MANAGIIRPFARQGCARTTRIVALGTWDQVGALKPKLGVYRGYTYIYIYIHTHIGHVYIYIYVFLGRFDMATSWKYQCTRYFTLTVSSSSGVRMVVFRSQGA